MKGKYNYRHAVGSYPNFEYVGYTMRVEVLGETPKMYKVKYLEFHANGAPPGTITNVQKRNVMLEGGLTKGTTHEPRQYDPELIRKPYKDD